MSADAWIAIAGLAVTVLIAVLGGAFQSGRHAQRLQALEEKTRDIGTLSVLAASLAELKLQIGELRHDVKNLLTGRVRPGSRAGD